MGTEGKLHGKRKQLNGTKEKLFGIKNETETMRIDLYSVNRLH